MDVTKENYGDLVLVRKEKIVFYVQTTKYYIYKVTVRTNKMKSRILPIVAVGNNEIVIIKTRATNTNLLPDEEPILTVLF